MRMLTLHIEGMSCGHCLHAVRGALEGISGVRVGSVSIGQADLEFDELLSDPERIASLVSEAGYPATPQPA